MQTLDPPGQERGLEGRTRTTPSHPNLPLPFRSPSRRLVEPRYFTSPRLPSRPEVLGNNQVPTRQRQGKSLDSVPCRRTRTLKWGRLEGDEALGESELKEQKKRGRRKKEGQRETEQEEDALREQQLEAHDAYISRPFGFGGKVFFPPNLPPGSLVFVKDARTSARTRARTYARTHRLRYST